MANFIDFEKIIIHNFGSYGHTELDVKGKGFCLVSGQNNFKKDNALSNGSGKSFIWSAICYTITGETIQGLKTNLKNINIEDDDKCYTTLIFKVNTDEYEITRTAEPKSELKIIKNGADVSGKTFRESEKKLGELLPDLTRDLIASTIIIGQGMPNKFSSFSPSGRKELLEKLTKSDFMIEDIKNRVTARQTELEKKVNDCDISLAANKAKLETAEKELKKAEDEINNTVKPNFEADIEASDKLLKSIDKDITKLSEARKAVDTQIESTNNGLLAVANEKAEKLRMLSESYHTAIDPVNQEKLTAETTIRNLQAEVTRLKAVKDTCPTCGQKLPGAVKPDTSSQEAQIKTLNESLIPLRNRITEINAKSAEYKQQIETEIAEKEVKLNTALTELKKERGRIVDEINDDTQSYNVEKERYNKLVYDKANWDIHQKALNKTIADLNEAITSLNNMITLTDNAKVEFQAHLAVVRKMDSLAKRDFRGYLLTNIIGYIDKKAKDYSEIVFGTRDLKVYLDGNALDISYAGKMFDNLSGGEKQRVDLILQFALRDMLNVYLNSGANILVLDEITDFLDKTSCAAIMKLIEKELTTIESVFIVSHHASELELPIDSEIKVVKDTNGISQII
jgi:DNA repair exonuclease SbcCD ATPase subunit